ncbi:hypothetical protein V6N13_023181 [Hibiscus sabdariffa]|uniref:Uncharacterized protein n=2 Tax=Hibiscus sabdariffa TaxID=183260 RepID=A0ABR2NWL1_9ROSI
MDKIHSFAFPQYLHFSINQLPEEAEFFWYFVNDCCCGSIINGGSEIGKNNYKVNSRGSSLVNHEFTRNGGTKMRPSSYLDGSRKRGPPKVWTNSEIGLSSSEVTAAVVKNMHYNRMDEAESSVGEGWSLDGSIEGL